MIQFRPIASSSSGCCYVVSCGDAPKLVLECGIRFDLIRQALNHRVSGLAGCLVSHSHGDHCKSAGEMTQAAVDVYAHPATWRGCKNLVAHRCKDLVELRPTKIGPWTVMAFPVVHDCEGTLGFQIDAPDGSRLVYVTDAMYSHYRFERVSVFAIEANWSREAIREKVGAGVVDASRAYRTVNTHMSIEQAVDTVKRSDLSRLEETWLLHLSAANSDQEAFKRAMQAATGKPVYIAEA